MKFTALVRRGFLLSCLAVSLAACNDSGGDSEPDVVYFRSLTGEANKVSYSRAFVPMSNNCQSCAELGAVVNSMQDFEQIVNTTTIVPNRDSLLRDSKVDFSQNTIIMVKSYHSFFYFPTIGEIQIETDKIRVFPLLCDHGGRQDGQEPQSQTWIVIRKTAKPIVIEPMATAAGETWPDAPPGAPARCDKLAIGQVS